MSSITSQQDRAATIAAEQSVAERVVYTAPAGDTAVIRSRGLFTYDSAASEYTPGKVIYVDVASRTHVLDTSRSFFSFNIKYQITSGDPADAVFASNNYTDASAEVTIVGPATAAALAKECFGLAGNEWAPPTVGDDLITNNPITGVTVQAVATTAQVVVTGLGAGQHNLNLAMRRRKWWRKDGDSNNLISSMRVLTRRGTAIESVNFYNHLAHTLQQLTMTEEEKSATGKITGHGAYQFGLTQHMQAANADVSLITPVMQPGHLPLEPSVHIFGKQNFVVGTEYGVARAVGDVAYQAAHFALDLRASGLWGMPQFIPIYLLEGIRFEFTLAPFLDAFKGIVVPTSTANTGQDLTSYKITNFKLYAEMVELAAPVKVALQAAVQQGGLPLMVPSYAVMQFSPGSSTTVTLRVTERLSHATAVFIWAAALAGNNTATFVSAFDHQHMKVTSFQLRVGQASIPDQPLQVATDTNWRDLDLPLYNLLRGAIGTLGPASKEFLPIYERWSKLKGGEAASASLTTRAMPNNFSYYTLGVSLQTSPGVDGSGMIIGDLADLVINMRVQTALESAASVTAPATRAVYVAIAHDRLVQVMDGGLINVTA